MEAKQLRMGNIVLSKPLTGNDKSYKEIVVSANEILRCVNNPLDFEQILLTEEWLLKFGFKKGLKGWFKKLDNNCKFNLYMYNDNLYEHVHLLQNLYFALTNEELTIK